MAKTILLSEDFGTGNLVFVGVEGLPFLLNCSLDKKDLRIFLSIISATSLYDFYFYFFSIKF